MWPNPQLPADLLIFTEENLDRKLHLSCSVDLMVSWWQTHIARRFQNFSVVETELSDFHKVTMTVMKTHFQKQTPKIINYRDYIIFSEVEYRQYILH